MKEPADAYLLITGSTGFIGHYLLAELLQRGRRCALLVRQPLRTSRESLARLLHPLQIDLETEVAREHVVLLEGDVCQGFSAPGVPLEGAVHLAAATRFTTDLASGEPWKTNVAGTQRLLEELSRLGVMNLHFVSSAYACGKVASLVPEVIDPSPRSFHNDYEETKWAAELACARWATLAAGRRLTVYRPSIVVGDQRTGRSTRFNGFYLLARATDLLHRSLGNADRDARHNVRLRIRGRGDNCQNIVPVDYVATAIANVIGSDRYQGEIYHLVHPNPPTNHQIKLAMERHFDIGGGRFVSPEEFDDADLNEREQAFYDVSRPIEHYFVDSPRFARHNTDRIDQAFQMGCPDYTCDSIARLVQYAQACNWGRRPDTRKPRTAASAARSAAPCAVYFERFLPRCLATSRVARMTALTVTVRFIIDDELNGQWVCRFVRGRLAQVHRGSNSLREDFAYRSNRTAFWRAISGKVHPQELFLDGNIDISGNVERALKMAMILHAFTREFPCDPQTLIAESRRSGDAICC